jgi:hypothetical protein
MSPSSASRKQSSVLQRDSWLLTLADLLLLLLCFFLCAQAGVAKQHGTRSLDEIPKPASQEFGAQLAKLKDSAARTGSKRGAFVMETTFEWKAPVSELDLEKLLAGLGPTIEVLEIMKNHRVLLRVSNCVHETSNRNAWADSVQRLGELKRQISDKLLPQAEFELEAQGHACLAAKRDRTQIKVQIYG